jgi:hypothetical protein
MHMDHNALHAASVYPLESSSLTMAMDEFYAFIFVYYVFMLLLVLPNSIRDDLPSPMEVISATGQALNRLKSTFDPGTATICIQVALDMPNRRDRQSLHSTLRRVVPLLPPEPL